MDELSDFDRHDAGACGGVGDLCQYCDQAMAARIKSVSSALSSVHVEEASGLHQDIAIAKSARTTPAISGMSPFARPATDDSAVDAGGAAA